MIVESVFPIFNCVDSDQNSLKTVGANLGPNSQHSYGPFRFLIFVAELYQIKKQNCF